MAKRHDVEVTDEQWEKIRPHLPERKRSRKGDPTIELVGRAFCGCSAAAPDAAFESDDFLVAKAWADAYNAGEFERPTGEWAVIQRGHQKVTKPRSRSAKKKNLRDLRR